MANFNLNKVMVAGRLTADPELRTTPSGVATTSFSIAVNGRGKDAQVVYIDAVAWRQQAEFITKYFKKGSSIYIEGALNPRNWTDDKGSKHYKTEVVVDNVSFVDGRSDNAGDSETEDVPEEAPAEEAPKPKRTRKTKAETVTPTEDAAEDLPF